MGDSLDKVVDIVVDLHEDALNIIVGAGQIDVVDVGRGVVTLTEAAISGDEDALLQLGTLVVSGAIAVASAGTGSTWFVSTLSLVSSWVTAYNIASTLESIGAISEQELQYLKYRMYTMQQAAINAYASMSIMGNKNKWMPGGDYYNNVYAGGVLFNVTGSRSQHKFLGRPDGNSNKRLGRMLGNDHDFHRMTSAHKVGGEDFSVFMFDRK